jgi:hypothetical protein
MMLQQSERQDIRIILECTHLSNFTMVSLVYLILPLQASDYEIYHSVYFVTWVQKNLDTMLQQTEYKDIRINGHSP